MRKISEPGMFPKIEAKELESVEEKIARISDEVCAQFFAAFQVEKILLDPTLMKENLDERLILISHAAIYNLPRELFLVRLSDFPENLRTNNFASLLKSATKTKIVEYFKELAGFYRDDEPKTDFLRECIDKVSLIDVNR